MTAALSRKPAAVFVCVFDDTFISCICDNTNTLVA